MKLRIALVVTGDMERLGLADSLAHVFGAHAEFETRQVQGFTSTDCAKALTESPKLPSNAEAFIDTLRTLLVQPVRRRDKPFDFVIGVEDTELYNVAQPESVTAYLRKTIEQRLTTLPKTEASVEQEKLATRCSFHLLTPMPEAYFFGDTAAVERAGKLPDKTNHFDPKACDVEAFVVQDDDYSRFSNVTGSHWRKPQRGRHPKLYLEFLSDPPPHDEDPVKAAERGRTWIFKETGNGADALRQLNWGLVLRDPKHGRFARSLFHDIAEMLDVDYPFPGECHEVTRATAKTKLLRNL